MPVRGSDRSGDHRGGHRDDAGPGDGLVRRAGKAVAVDRGDHRLPNVQSAIEKRELLRAPQRAGLGILADLLLDVSTGAEGFWPSPGDDGAADGGIVTHFDPGAGQAAIMPGIQRVHAVGTVDGVDGDPVSGDFEFDGHDGDFSNRNGGRDLIGIPVNRSCATGDHAVSSLGFS